MALDACEAASEDEVERMYDRSKCSESGCVAGDVEEERGKEG